MIETYTAIGGAVVAAVLGGVLGYRRGHYVGMAEGHCEGHLAGLAARWIPHQPTEAPAVLAGGPYDTDLSGGPRERA